MSLKETLREKWNKEVEKIEESDDYEEANSFAKGDGNTLFIGHAYPESILELDSEKVLAWWLAKFDELAKQIENLPNATRQECYDEAVICKADVLTLLQDKPEGK